MMHCTKSNRDKLHENFREETKKPFQLGKKAQKSKISIRLNKQAVQSPKKNTTKGGNAAHPRGAPPGGGGLVFSDKYVFSQCQREKVVR